MAVLSNKDILRELETGNIVIHDPDDRNNVRNNIQNCSVDITLGKYYFSHTQEYSGQILNPWSAESVRDYWGSVKVSSKVNTQEESDYLKLPLGSSYILLYPGQSILAHTNEYIGGKNHITTMMKSRSSLGRCNVTICRDAGWGDIGYINRWTLEITNYSSVPVVLRTGSRIGQIIFFYTGEPESVYSGKYQKEHDLQTLIKNWTPEDLLPKCHMDKNN